ncbi:calcium-binding protein [Tropicibacter naphthalenivorans]|uniref:Poly(Beta-D-mannuronate) C5 epimerase 2 n=1 Tax=Tropicibacter naphthalenivorans TaxID=441103 RepID=A0A0P1G486_9RHOB|nr:calcium-binding protein [Tropicibacter naphthalenivorans]CUH76612.1 Poly(beta-D-mannuronate) C5 epimerase 2 [Tropicibacter naphthalenivorans]SMC64711.1 Hemolysin-type calcium-binding repeat-containing protein [Tropicibacter naphthalenivorans]
MPMISGTNNADTLTATTAEDTIYGQDGDDSLTAAGVAVDYMAFMPLELHGGNGNDTLVGGDNSENLFGDADDDLLYGNGGYDMIDLGNNGNPSGNDTAYGGAGNDTFLMGDGNDVVDGGDGIDIIEFDMTDEAAASSFSLDLWRDTSITHANGTLSFTSVESFKLSNAAHLSAITLQGRPAAQDKFSVSSAIAVKMYGLGGNDTLYSWTADDTVLGGNGNDAINGRAGNDYLDGGADDDYIWGDLDNDFIIGGTGADTLQGGTGRDVYYGGARGSGADGDVDTFRFYSGDMGVGATRDVIRDFEDGVDLIDLSGFSGTFTFIGATRFTGAGMEIQAGVLGSGNTLIRIDTNGDSNVDEELLLLGSQTLTADDFVL